jgi:NAD+ synthase (glutamine-hydrolysing)
MAGGFAVLKDISKMLVYRISNYRNSLSPVIPERVITRAPSAELRPDQTDQDSLPPYDVLDGIMEAYVEHNEGLREIEAHGYSRKDIERVIQLLRISEYKRRQAPFGSRRAVSVRTGAIRSRTNIGTSSNNPAIFNRSPEALY